MENIKVVQPPYIALRPVPVVLVSCGHGPQANIISIAWVGVVCSNPPQVAIAVRPERHSHGLIQKTGEFVVNIPTEAQVADVEYCGTVSGRGVDKFAARGLTPLPGTAVRTPLIAECPVNIECRVAHTFSLGTHDLFVGQVVAVQVSADVLDEHGQVDHRKVRPILYTGDAYWGLGTVLKDHG